MESLYSVGEVCKKTGVSRKTLYYYDHIHLLEPTERRGTQQIKYYDEKAICILVSIREYRQAGLSIQEIKKLFQVDRDSKIELLKKVKQRVIREYNEKELCIRQLEKWIKDIDDEKE